jgi:putative DNA primase/helicase
MKKSRAVTTNSHSKDDSPNPHVLSGRFLQERGQQRGARSLRFYKGSFWRWDGSRYLLVSKEQLRAEVTHVMYEEADRQSGEAGKAPFRVTHGLVTNVIQAMCGETLVDENVDLPVLLSGGALRRNLVALANGLLDLEAILDTGNVDLLPPTPEWFSTVVVPYNFDPTADCPWWQAFLSEVLEGDQERISFLQEWFGYCLTNDTSEQKFLVLEGEGANGKSVVCNILTAMLGEDNVSNVPLELFGERFSLYSTYNKLANIAPEVGDLKSVAEGYLKQFTAGDRMHFDRKNLAPIEGRPTARLVLATNNRPAFSDRSSGLWRRMLVVPFNVTIPTERQDKAIEEKLKAQLPGIFNWAVEGEKRRRRQGGFTQSTVVSETVNDYRQEMNPAGQFLTEWVEVDAEGRVPSGDLYTKYRGWCEANGYEPLSSRVFGREVKRKFGITKRRGSSGKREHYYPGIRLLSEVEDPDEPTKANLMALVGAESG